MSKRIDLPKIPQFIEETTIDGLSSEACYRNVLVTGEMVIGKQTSGVIFDETHAKNVVFQDMKFRSFECSDVLFENCQFINCEFIGSFIRRTKFLRCRLIGVNFSEASMQHVTFENSVLELAAFYYTKMHWISFKNSTLRNSDFYEDDAKNWHFSESKLFGVEINKTSLVGVDFRTCLLEDLRVTFEVLKGCIVTPTQALGMATLLGLTIKEDWE